jgi:hypothetical protein
MHEERREGNEGRILSVQRGMGLKAHRVVAAGEIRAAFIFDAGNGRWRWSALMDTLKGKKIMVWTFMGNTRMYNALRDYGDRISQIGLFSFKVRATGEIYESGVSISSMLTYINRYPHINWLLTVANDGTNSIFRALRDNTNGAQDMVLLGDRPHHAEISVV